MSNAIDVSFACCAVEPAALFGRYVVPVRKHPANPLHLKVLRGRSAQAGWRNSCGNGGHSFPVSHLIAMSTGALSYYLAGKSLDTAVTELTTQVREAQSLAVATGNTYRIDFSDSARTTYTLQRRSGSDWINVRGAISLPGGVSFSISSLPRFGSDGYMEFYARGTSESGQIAISGRYGGSRILTVDGETVNVR